MYDCLIIGHNDMNFQEYVKILKSMGTEHPDFRDLNLNTIEYNGTSYRALDILTHFHQQDEDGIRKPFHNFDLLWMTVTYLGTYLSRRGFSFDYINLFQLEKEQLKEKLTTQTYLTIAITTSVYNFDEPILEVISFIRTYNTTAKIIVGGPYISKRYERMDQAGLQAFFKYLAADFYVFCREGEQALVKILKALKNRGSFHRIDNIASREGNDYIINALAPERNPLEENLTDYSLFRPGDFSHFVNMRISKGCPYACSFCGFPLRAEKYKYLGVEYIEKEMDAIRDIGSISHLFFIDDTVNVPKRRFKEMLRMMIRKKYGFKWHCFFRCDQWDEETVALMQESGCEGVFLGLESANATLLQRMNKTAGKEEYRKAIPLFKQAGMIVFVSIFVGFPGETVQTYQETLDFLAETQPDFYRPQLWYCEPLTPIWEQGEKYGLKGYHFGWSHNTMDARTACDLLEKSLLALDTPIWVPDPGCNFTSVYYLKQRGMSLEQVKTFLKCFNAAVKEKYLYPGKKDISPSLWHSLHKSCRFDKPGDPDLRPVEVLSAPGYLEAEKFWMEEFKNLPGTRPFPGQFRHGMPGNPAKAQAGQPDQGRELIPPRRVEKYLANQLNQVYEEDLTLVILAVFCLLLLKENEAAAVLTVLEDKEVVPLPLFPLHQPRFKGFCQILRQRLQQARAHPFPALHFLCNPWRMAQYGSSCPVFTTAFLVTEYPEDTLEKCLAFFPAAAPGIHLVLRLDRNRTTDEINIRFEYSPARYSQNSLEKLHSRLETLLITAAESPDALIETMIPDTVQERRHSVIEFHASKTFNF